MLNILMIIVVSLRKLLPRYFRSMDQNQKENLEFGVKYEDLNQNVNNTKI